MAFQVRHKERYLARNPVVVELSGTAGSVLRYDVTDISAPAQPVRLYEGLVMLPEGRLTIDLSFAFAGLHDRAGAQHCRLALTEEGGTAVEREFTVYGGGVSRLYMRRAEGGDVFAGKLKNAGGNFFLTTRTASNVIGIPECELLVAPRLYFYAAGLSFDVVASGQVLERHRPAAGAAEQLWYVTLSSLRDRCGGQYGFTPSVLDIVPEGTTVPACRVVVTQSRPTDYFIRFLNSYGVEEAVALYGVIEYTPEWEAPEDIMRYDTAVGGFTRAARRKSYTSKYTARTGCRTAAGRIFLMDMLCSPACEFIAHGEAYAAKVSAETPLLESTGGEAADVTLTIELLDRDDSYSPTDFGGLDFAAHARQPADNAGVPLTDNIGSTISD